MRDARFRREAENCREIFTRIFAGSKLHRRRKPSEWALEERNVSLGPLARDGAIKWSFDLFPHLREPMDAMDDPSVNIIVLWFARRIGKTEGLCLNGMGWIITDNPGGIISLWPIESRSDLFSQTVFEPYLQAHPELEKLFVAKKSRESGRTIDYKKYLGGEVYLINAGAASKTRGMAVVAVFLHEVDAYKLSTQKEGDPIEKAMGRTEGFPDAVKVIEGTGTIAAGIGEDGKKVYNSNIEKWYDRGDQRKWFCPCRKCGHRQWLRWEQIQTIQGQWLYCCESCDTPHDESAWRTMVQLGEWRATATGQIGIRSYWINGFNSLLPTGKGYKSKLEQFAIEGRRALAGTPEERQVWINEVKTELVAAKDAEPPPAFQPILDGREDYGRVCEAYDGTPARFWITIPSPARVLTTFTDLHPNRLEIEWRAWSPLEESWGVMPMVLFGDTNNPEVWREWIKRMATKWKHELGGEMSLDIALVDAGWNTDAPIMMMYMLAEWRLSACCNSEVSSDEYRTQYSMIPVYACQKCLKICEVYWPGANLIGKVRLSKGTEEHRAVIADMHGSIAGRAKGIHIGTWKCKRLIYDRLAMHGKQFDGAQGRTPDLSGAKLSENTHSAECALSNPIPGFIHFHRGYTHEHIRQCVSEIPSYHEKMPDVLRFDNPKGNRNEGLDQLVGNLAAFTYGHSANAWDYAAIERRLRGEKDDEMMS